MNVLLLFKFECDLNLYIVVIFEFYIFFKFYFDLSVFRKLMAFFV